MTNDEIQQAKRGRGRPSKGRRSTVVLPEEYWQWIADPAGGRQHGLSASDVIRVALDHLRHNPPA